MLAAAYRLRRSDDFAAVVRTGRRAGRGALVVHLTIPDDSPSILDQTGTDQSARPRGRSPHQQRHEQPARAVASGRGPVRAGFVVSRAVGKAVVRNKVRRRLRHLVAERLDKLPPGATLVVRALPEAAGSPYRRLGADLDAAIEAARGARPRRTSGRRG